LKRPRSSFRYSTNPKPASGSSSNILQFRGRTFPAVRTSRSKRPSTAKQLSQVKWYSDRLGQYHYRFAPKGEKYVFVYVAEYMDGNTTEKDPRAWYFGPHLFRIEVDGLLYDQDRECVMAVRIKDLDEVEYNWIRGLRPFGYLVSQSRGTGNITAIEGPWLHWGN